MTILSTKQAIEELCRLYVSYLVNMVSDAKETFL